MSDRIFAATRKGLFTIERSGSGAAKWAIAKVEFLGDNVSMVLPDPRDGSCYAALEHGHFGCKLHRRSAGSPSFEPCAVPSYPKQPEGEVDRDPMGRVIAWNLVKVWVLEPGAASEPGTVWCGTLPGGLFRSRDHGASWELIRPLWDHPLRKFWLGGGYDVPGIHSICVDPRDARIVRAGVSSGGVWTTRDGGATWVCEGTGMRAEYVPPELTHEMNAQDVHRLVQSPSAPDRLWIQHHNGIFVTSDGGASWTEITKAGPAVFGFAATVHPREPDTAWFVPGTKDERRIPVDARRVVTRTRDGGKTFEVLHRGLPQSHAYHLVYRHGLDVDRTGQRLAMASTTGTIWVSEDAGDSWSTISTDLPPVHCVRFAA